MSYFQPDPELLPFWTPGCHRTTPAWTCTFFHEQSPKNSAIPVPRTTLPRYYWNDRSTYRPPVYYDNGLRLQVKSYHAQTHQVPNLLLWYTDPQIQDSYYYYSDRTFLPSDAPNNRISSNACRNIVHPRPNSDKKYSRNRFDYTAAFHGVSFCLPTLWLASGVCSVIDCRLAILTFFSGHCESLPPC
jgi:hypothetical protein